MNAEYDRGYAAAERKHNKEWQKEWRKKFVGIFVEEHFTLVGRSGSVFQYQADDFDYSINSIEINAARYLASGKKPPKYITVTVKKTAN
jgi:hypothetical protein